MTQNQTQRQAERDLYLSLLHLSQHYPTANDWLARLPTWLADIKDKSRYAHAPAYQSAVARLPEVDVSAFEMQRDAITAEVELSGSEQRQITALMKGLMPWRKGPFQIGSVAPNSAAHKSAGIHIDTEWRSDHKWQRVLPHLSPLANRRILDVGGGSGYHGWRMAGEGAKLVYVIDPSCLFYHQFLAIKHFAYQYNKSNNHRLNNILPHQGADQEALPSSLRVHHLPVALEDLPLHSGWFDTVFSMGVLYHRASPFEHLNLLKGQLVAGGELVLETLVVEGDEHTVLVPQHRYAQMNNVYFLPSVPALMLWLEKAGFREVCCVDVSVTSTQEQRQTDWMTFHSLADFLHPNDPSKTVEGYPAPCRAVLVAKK